jgi:hypothetical protein
MNSFPRRAVELFREVSDDAGRTRKRPTLTPQNPYLGDITQLTAAVLNQPVLTKPEYLAFGVHTNPLRGLNPMFRFDRLIRRDTIVRDVKQRHPETIPVLEALHFRTPCDDCDIDTVARKNGLSVLDVVDALNRAAFGQSSDHAGSPSLT